MQYVHPAGQPRLVTMKVKGPLMSGIRYRFNGSSSCIGIGRSSRSAMNGRSALTITSPARRQTSPLIAARFTPFAIGWGRYDASCLRNSVSMNSGRSNCRPSRWSMVSRSVRSGSPRKPKSSEGYGRSVSRGIGVICVPRANVVAPTDLARNVPYRSFCSVGAVSCVT